MSNFPPPDLGWKGGSHGRIASLPRRTRDHLNQLMDDGLTYAGILQTLGAEAAHITADCLKRWRKTGHKKWLKERERVDQMKHMREVAIELLRANKDKPVEEASCQTAVSHIFTVLMDYDPAELKSALDDNPEFFARLAAVLATISGRSLDFEQRRDRLAEQKAKVKEAIANANQRGMTPEAMDEFKRTLNLM